MLTQPLKLTAAERAELTQRARSRAGRAHDARVARLLLLLSDGRTYREIAELVDCSEPFISKWKRRFETDRVAGLYTRHAGREATALTAKMEARILDWTRRTPPDGTPHWSTRRLAKRLGVHHMMVARVWQKNGIQPHRLERSMASDDPDFETKAADVIGLYLHPPHHAAVFSVDEKTAIQALDRKDPILPFSPGRAERHGSEYIRHGTLSLYAALNTRTGMVFGQTAERHTSQAFIAFLASLLTTVPARQEVHVICDNLSAHKAKQVEAFVAEHPRLHLHFTPTYSSWLNQVELWVSKIERDLIHRGVFLSVKDLARRIRKYIRLYNKDPRPIKWKYSDPTNRIRVA
jgi:transposase